MATLNQLEAARKYRKSNPEKTRAACQKWREANREKAREATKRWVAANPEKAKAAQAAYRAANPEKTREWAKNYRARVPDYSIRRYGVTLEKFIAMAVSQNARCAICGLAKKLCVDHNHELGKVRGLLCKKCNSALGLLQDSEEITENAVRYLRRTSLCS